MNETVFVNPFGELSSLDDYCVSGTRSRVRPAIKIIIA